MTKKRATSFPVMENMTVKMIREYLNNKLAIIIPVGVIEQHGYHLPLKTDALIATHLGRMIGERTGILVAPTMYESFSGGGCPGTINISPATMSMVISDRLISLASQGFRNFYLFVCHGGSENFRALDNALKLLLRTNPLFEKSMIVLLPCLKLSPKGRDIVMRSGDWHAALTETAMVMALEPELVRMDEMKADKEPIRTRMIEHPDNYQHAEKIVNDPCVVPRMRQRPDVKVGVMGYPDKATPELGRELNDEIVANASRKIMELESKADGIYKEVEFKPEPLIFD
jgi:creatinine amidohydrolase